MLTKSRNLETGKVDIVALGQRTTAHGLSLSRIVIGSGAVEYISTHADYRSIATAGVIGGVAAATDFADGHFARRAAKRLKGLTTRAGQWIDQLSDKFYAHSILGSIALREMISGNKAYGAGIALFEVPILARDVYATRLRAKQPQGVDIKARWPGKVKAALGMGVMTAAASPLADGSLGEAAVVAGMGVFATTSITSGIELVRSMRAQNESHPTQSSTEAA